MIELTDTLPDINVQPAEFKRLLGYPRDRVLEGRARELADWARAWYAKNGRPWVYARQAGDIQIKDGSVVIDSVSFTSKRLQKTLQQAEASGAILVAVGAGPEIEQEAGKAWQDEKPDEYFFLEVFGSAIVEHLTTTTGARLCAWAEAHGMAVLPHCSPGYPEWDISEQPRLLELILRTSEHSLPGRLEVLASGMLRPKKALLAVFGLTHQTERVRKLTELVPCENCSYSPCQYRRSPYLRAAENVKPEVPTRVEEDTIEAATKAAVIALPLHPDAKYGISSKALKRWADERLVLEHHANGTIDALFRYEGTTCSNMGRTMLFEYRVQLGSREEGYLIRQQQCGPAAGDVGHTFMCRYMNNAEHLMVAIDHEKPLLGQRLNDVLSWDRPASAPGCYCEPASRKHKWGLVFETIHYALVQHERRRAEQVAMKA